MAKEIIAQYGHADAFMAANVMCHIPYLNSVFAGMVTSVDDLPATLWMG